MLHLMKLAVGIRDTAHLRERQREHARLFPPLHHRTRSFPRRAEEVVNGGSIYWVVSGLLLVRQLVTAIVPSQRDDGTACTELRLAEDLVPVEIRPVKAFQGWRYLQAESAPPDLSSGRHNDVLLSLPEPLRMELQALCLL